MEDDKESIGGLASEICSSEYQSIIKEFQAFLSDCKDVLDEATTMRLLERLCGTYYVHIDSSAYDFINIGEFTCLSFMSFDAVLLYMMLILLMHIYIDKLQF